MRKNIERKLKKIETKEYKAVVRALQTFGFGIVLKCIVSIVGFLVGTYFYSEENVFYLKVDKFFANIGNLLLFGAVMLAMVFVARLFKFKNQREVLESIQIKR